MAAKIVRCQHCQTPFRMNDESLLGKMLRCSHCSRTFEVKLEPESTSQIPPINNPAETNIPPQVSPPPANRNSPPPQTPNQSARQTANTQTANNQASNSRPGFFARLKQKVSGLRAGFRGLSKKKKLLVTFAGGGVFVLCLVCVITTIMTVWVGTVEQRADLSYISTDSKYIYRVTPAKLVANSDWRQYMKDENISLEKIERYSDLKASEVESVTLGIPAGHADRAAVGNFSGGGFAWALKFAVVVRTNVDINREPLLRWTDADRTQDVNGHKVHRCGKRFSLCFINDRTFVFGTNEMVESGLNRPLLSMKLEKFKFLRAKDEIQFAYDAKTVNDSSSRIKDSRLSRFQPVATGSALKLTKDGFHVDRLTLYNRKSSMPRLRRRRWFRRRRYRGENYGAYTLYRIQINDQQCQTITKQMLGFASFGNVIYRTKLDLQHKDPEIQTAAIRALIGHRTEESAQLLVSLIEDPKHQALAVELLNSRKDTNAADRGKFERALHKYLDINKQYPAEIRKIALQVLAKIGSRMSDPFIRKWINDKKLGANAQHALNQIERRSNKAPRRRR